LEFSEIYVNFCIVKPGYMCLWGSFAVPFPPRPTVIFPTMPLRPTRLYFSYRSLLRVLYHHIIPASYRGWALQFVQPSIDGYAVLIADRKFLKLHERLAGVTPEHISDLCLVIRINTYLIQQDWKTSLWEAARQRLDRFENSAGLAQSNNLQILLGPSWLGFTVDITPLESQFQQELWLRGLD
jgi:hypothetical protein